VTAGDPLTASLGPSGMLVEDDTEDCLCLVVGYAKDDGLIARVTAEVKRRVTMSPALGDFLQLRHVDLGPQPGSAGGGSLPVRRIVDDLMAAKETAGRSHFALIVIARSAMTIEGLLGSCTAEPFLAGLRMRLIGIASYDDRKPGDGLVDITSSAEGRWRDERELIDALRQRCGELPHYFATRGEPGLTRGELATLRHAHAQPAADGDGPEGGADGLPDETPLSDVLEDAPESPITVPRQDVALASPADTGAAESAAGRRTVVSASRWLPAVPGRRRKHAAKPGDQESADAANSARKALGLIYLFMIVDPDSAADPSFGRLQDALRDVDRRLAAQPSCGYQVRVIHGSDSHLRGELLAAGSVSRRASKRLVKAGDFATVLRGIRTSLRRDRELVQTIATAEGLTVARPAIVIFTADPPMADLDAAKVFGDLAAEATLAWVVPGKLEGLVSPAFARAWGAMVLGEHQAVADEVIDVIKSNALLPERDRQQAMP
jgi:hypothetical protein